MAVTTLRPTNGLSALGLGSWGLVSAAENSIYPVGNDYHSGALYTLPDLRYVKITKITLRVRMEASTPPGLGVLYTEPFVYVSANELDGYTYHAKQGTAYLAYNVTGLTGAAQTVDFDVTNDAGLFGQYPRGIAFPLLLFPGSDWGSSTGFFRVHPYQSLLIIEHEPYPLPAPSITSPTGGKFTPGAALPVTWKYNASQSPNDKQTGSVLEYSRNNGAWVVAANLTGAVNNYAIPAGTFSQGDAIRLRVMTKSAVGDSGYSAAVAITAHVAKPPDTLQPDGVYRNPGAAILCTWQYVKSDANDDAQKSSALRHRVTRDGVVGAWVETNLNNTLNSHSFPPGTFTDGDLIEWQVRTVSNVGTSDWSGAAMFTLAITPPLAPVPTYPVSVSGVNATNGVALQWAYNSEHDASPSRFDIEYRVDGGVWAQLTNDGQLQAHIPAAVFDDGERHAVEWRVKGYGEFGDGGAWSETVVFWTVGAPRRPVIVEVTNSNIPTVHFAAANLLGWELEIVQNGETVYASGARPFNNEFAHRLDDFLQNGNYVARMRIVNEYGLYSGWAERAFTISAEPPEALPLRCHANTRYFIRLSFPNSGGIVYIYRAVMGEAGTPEPPGFRRIGKTRSAVYDDHTAAPSVRYAYFARIVNDDAAYADSNTETAAAGFKETLIADSLTPDDVLILSVMLGQKPAKNAAIGSEKTLTQLEGRRYPFLQAGGHRSRSIAYSFYCGRGELERLEELAACGNVLILRDWRYGTVYGTIDGGVSASAEMGGGYVVGFTFTQTDYAEEVPLE